ncbi:unnamed protein product, partial [Onchocerca ochengi]|uniref:Symplekin_C domain-containing protein n=1 Tax=Onchocerca ochengi TaxID=42157 RepID=A0A182EU08_ONCOC
MEGTVIPPTSVHQFTAKQQNETQQSESVLPAALLTKTKQKIQFGLLSITKELDREQSLKLILFAFQRILANEKRAIQGGVGVAQQKLLVRLVTRLDHDSCAEFDDLLMNFIVQEQKSRTELALLWIAELYAQFQGGDVREHLICSIDYCTKPGPPPQFYAYEKEDAKPQWDDAAIRVTLNLFLSILPLDHSLIHILAAVYAKSSNDIKRIILRTIDSAIKSMGATSEHLLEMIE